MHSSTTFSNVLYSMTTWVGRVFFRNCP